MLIRVMFLRENRETVSPARATRATPPTTPTTGTDHPNAAQLSRAIMPALLSSQGYLHWNYSIRTRTERSRLLSCVVHQRRFRGPHFPSSLPLKNPHPFLCCDGTWRGNWNANTADYSAATRGFAVCRHSGTNKTISTIEFGQPCHDNGITRYVDGAGRERWRS